MANRRHTNVMTFQGGYATDLAPQVNQLDFLVRAENVIYEVTGAIRKVGGTTRLNSTALTGAPSILGMFDFWIAGGSGSFTQNFVVTTSDSKIYSFGSGSTASAITGVVSFGADAYPVFMQARDLLTFWWSDGSAPAKYSGTGDAAALGGSPPSARTAAYHINRGWAAGTNANPSRLFYSSSVSIEDWTGADTGSIDIDPEDGDRILGLISYKQKLIVFKGPNKGSIHVISGTAPTGSEAFARTLLIRGLALQSPNGMIEVGDDVLFVSQYGIHSLVATERFGDFSESMVTRFLTDYFRTLISRSRLTNVTAVNYASKGCVLFTFTRSGQSVNDQAFGLSYIRRTEEGIKPFVWNRTCQSAAIRQNSSGIKELVFGSNNGFVLQQDVATRTMAPGTGYALRITTPQVVLGVTDSAGTQRVDQPVTLHRMWMRSRPVGNHNISVNLQRDDSAPETYNFNQGQVGFILDSATNGLLNTSTLGGGNLQISAQDLVGEARSVSLDITQGGAGEDANIYEIGIEFTPASEVQTVALTG